MKNYKPFFEKFFNNQLTSEEFEKFLSEIEKIIKKVLRTSFYAQIEEFFQKLCGTEYLRELAYELLLRFLRNRDYLLSLNYINEKYIFSCAKNFILQHLSSGFKSVKKEISFANLKSQESLEEEKINLEESLPQYVVDYLETHRIYHIIRILKERLTSKELETLCWYIYKQIYQEEFQLNVDRNVIYKRWERLRPKLREILREDLDEEITSSKLFELIRSEICEKLSYILK
ncbi:MAG: hypothetical protein C0169_06585 [Thermodesulfobacterium geofontis]|uniref:Uncharacterized protein n=1 Tax=Thermodesulfobacterium geofontis TaxID=1295609 RepID=A0A2N7Q850_9BACT|nr:MAG: hypothetical protein C0169_06585 [Thermodesulfobacterium geofontis]